MAIVVLGRSYFTLFAARYRKMPDAHKAPGLRRLVLRHVAPGSSGCTVVTILVKDDDRMLSLCFNIQGATRPWAIQQDLRQDTMSSSLYLQLTSTVGTMLLTAVSL